MNNRRERLLHMAQGALIAALYATLTVIFAPISFGPIQVRIAEALTVLPMFTSAAISGLFIGCIIANLNYMGCHLWLAGDFYRSCRRISAAKKPLAGSHPNDNCQRYYCSFCSEVRLWRGYAGCTDDALCQCGRNRRLLCAW